MRRPAMQLRGRLALLIAAIVVGAGTLTFVAVYRGTGDRLRAGLESDLRDQVAELAARVSSAATPRQAGAQAREYISAQPFSATSRLLIVSLAGRPAITNEPEVLGVADDQDAEAGRVRAREAKQSRDLNRAPGGFTTVSVEDVGSVRLLSRRVRLRDGTAAVVRAGEPLEPVERAQEGVARTFLVAGSITLLIAVAAGYLVAARVSAPLRRIARTATEVDSGELSRRIEASGPRDEVRALADSFDHMLDRLEEAFARQREFVSDASHELRTPLTVVRGQLEILARQEHPPQDEVRRVERLVAAEVARMQRLVDDLLVLARGDEGLVPQKGPVELTPFLEDLVDGLAPTADRRFETTVPAGLAVQADPELLAQVLRNLLRNAVEHTEAGGVVAVSASARSGWVEIAVDDDGPGIEPSELHRVFDRFHRTDAARSRSGGGSGLGLAIARTLVEAQGGRIRAEPSPRGGARVALELPV